MARKPRPVNPTDGPIAAFAYDLRAVREEAGNPTYRALAAVAGFSATTLSDAAGGVRLPSLDVTLAYVGACDGDTALWERRWRELDRELADGAEENAGIRPPAEPAPRPERAAPSALPAGPGAPEPPPAGPDPTELPPADDLAQGGHSLPPWARWPAAAAALAVVTVLGLLALRAGEGGRAAAAPSGPPCPVTGPTAAFSGTTYNVNTIVRAGASLSAPVVMQVPKGCSLEFSGYCLGDTVVDVTSGSPDMRWFKVATGGVVSSGVVHGNPPASMAASACADAVPPPSAVSLGVVAAGPGVVELRATGNQVGIVGYATYTAPSGSSTRSPAWRQLGLTEKAAAGFAVPWRLDPAGAGAPADATVPVVAVACLGGGGPTTVVDARQLPLSAAAKGVTGPLEQARLTPADLAKAEAAACSYPQPG